MPGSWSRAGWTVYLRNCNQAEAIVAKTFPAIHQHLAQFREPLMKRQDKGRFWWELRSCAYREEFAKPKIMYHEIQFHPCYALDRTGSVANNKVFMLPTDDLYLLGVLNSPRVLTRLGAILAIHAVDLGAGAIVSVTEAYTRVRRLPIRGDAVGEGRVQPAD